jgi:hypothetical protein
MCTSKPSLHVPSILGALARRLGVALALVGSLALFGCATHYVDGNTPELPTSGYIKPAQPHPVQVVFEFRTRGVPNSRVTDLLREQAIHQVRESGLFSRIDLEPSPEGGLLALSLDNVVSPDESPKMKGAVTGATLFLVKNFVRDDYVCTARYAAPGETAPLEKAARHAIHTSIGAVGGSPPAGAVQAQDVKQAVQTVLKQALSQVLDALSRDPAFK